MLKIIVEGTETAARHERSFVGVRPTVPRSCPFCGIDPPLATQLHGRFIVGCESDDCHVNPQVSGDSLGQAWARWNSRPAGA